MDKETIILLFFICLVISATTIAYMLNPCVQIPFTYYIDNIPYTVIQEKGFCLG